MPEIRQFESGATRNPEGDKFDYEGFLNPEVLYQFGKYMHEHRHQRDGTLRDSDNWQKGIPFRVYVKSLVRHVIDLWRMERGYIALNPDTSQPHTKEELCCAIMFNVMGYLKELVDPSAINRPVPAVVPQKSSTRFCCPHDPQQCELKGQFIIEDGGEEGCLDPNSFNYDKRCVGANPHVGSSDQEAV